MKLILATVGYDDLAALLIALVREGFRATAFTSGYPLHTHAGLMIGVPEAAVPDVLAVFRRICRPHPRPALSLVPGLATPPPGVVGGARYVVVNVVRFERITG